MIDMALVIIEEIYVLNPHAMTNLDLPYSIYATYRRYSSHPWQTAADAGAMFISGFPSRPQLLSVYT